VRSAACCLTQQLKSDWNGSLKAVLWFGLMLKIAVMTDQTSCAPQHVNKEHIVCIEQPQLAQALLSLKGGHGRTAKEGVTIKALYGSACCITLIVTG